MKKKIILGFLLASTYICAAQLQVPESVDDEINKSARSFSGVDKNNFINWQKRAYLKIQEAEKDADIPKEEFERIKERLHIMYGSNYQKQLQVLEDEIDNYKDLVQRITLSSGNAVPDENTNKMAKEELKNTIDSNNSVPKEIVDIYVKSAQDLYPNNFVAQKNYVNSMIENYPKIIEFIKQNKQLLD